MDFCTHDMHIDDRTLNRYADGVLPPRAAAAVRRHLRSCAVCRREVQQIRALSAALRAVPAPRPPEGLFEEMFPEEADPTPPIPFAVPQEQPVAFSRRVALSAGACLLALIAAVLVLTLGPERAMAGSSTLSFDREEPGALTLRYETISPLAAEPGLRARMRYWVPDSLRFGQTEPGYSVVDVSPEEPGVFSGAVALPPGAVYAVAVVEDLDGNYIDSDFGSFWEYFETDAEGRPTLQARRYQLLATSELSVARAAAVAEEAASQFPEQPEFWVRQFLFAQGAVPAESRDAFLREHAARFTELDRAAREGNPGPVELDALHRYATLLGRSDLATDWSSQLVDRYPRHGAAALVRLQSIMSSPVTNRRKLEALEENWARTGAPITAQLGLRLSIELADPTLTEEWLDRHSAGSAFRDLGYDTEVAGDMMAAPVLRPLAETWIRDRLANIDDELGPERPLDQSGRNFRAEASQRRARLNLYLARLHLARGQLASAINAVERSVRQTWSPEVFLEAAEIHESAGAGLRAAELLALALVDPVTPLRPHPRADGSGGVRLPSEEQLVAARATLDERVTSALLEEHVDLNARLRSAAGEETTLREAVHERLALVVQAFRPDFMSDDAFALLDANSERLRLAGVETLLVAQQPTPVVFERSAPDSFVYDVEYEAWDGLRAWRDVQYFVLDPSGRLRYRGENLEAALRISFVLSTRGIASPDAIIDGKDVDT